MKKSAEATLEKVFGRFRFPFPSSPTHSPSAHRYREDEEPTADIGSTATGTASSTARHL